MYSSAVVFADMGVAALRASLGHPEPFYLKYVEIGNEVRVQSSTESPARSADPRLPQDFFASSS